MVEIYRKSKKGCKQFSNGNFHIFLTDHIAEQRAWKLTKSDRIIFKLTTKIDNELHFPIFGSNLCFLKPEFCKFYERKMCLIISYFACR